MSDVATSTEPRARSVVDRVVRAHGGSTGTRLRALADGQPLFEEPVQRPAVVAVQLALAISWERALATGELSSRSAVASGAGLTRARVTQLMNLTLLAPDIQEEVLFLEASDGVEPVGEHSLRQVLRAGRWPAQRAAWRALRRRTGPAQTSGEGEARVNREAEGRIDGLGDQLAT